MKRLLAAGAMAAFGTGAYAGCAFENTTPVSISAAAFQAWKVVTSAMEECGNFSAELNQEFQEKQAVGFAASPSLYAIGGVANSSLVPLQDAGLIRPLDDLVAKYGANLTPAQLIRVDGQIVAIAMMVNAQHLMYREDILDDLGINTPKTYEDVLAAAAKIKAAGVVDYPLGGSWKTTWLEFVNMYLGYGGDMFKDGFQPNVNNRDGIAALEMMKALSAFMDPEYLVADSTYTQQQFQKGKIAIANFWASRAGAVNDPAESEVAGKIKFASAPAPTASGIPASTLWWDGIVIAKNIPDDVAEAAFRVALEGIDSEMANANPDAAIWIIGGYSPGEFASGATATAANGARPYPASSHMGLMQTAIANNIAAYLNGEKDATTTLEDMESDYVVAAKEAGIIK